MKKWTTLILYSGILVVAFKNFLVYYAGAITPGYHPLSNFISELSAEGTPYKDLMNMGSLIIPGFVLLLLARILNNRLEMPGNGLSMAYLGISGIGFMLIGLFPCPPGCLADMNSISMTVHLLAAFIATFSVNLAAMAYGFWNYKGHKSPLRQASLLMGSIGIVAFLFFWIPVILWEVGVNTPFLSIKGLMQRLNLAAGDLWVILACVSAIKSSNTSLKPSLN